MEYMEKRLVLDYLLQIATNRNISQKKLVEDIADYKYFNKMCNGKRNISMNIILKCADKLGVSFDELKLYITKNLTTDIDITALLDDVNRCLITQNFDELMILYHKLEDLEINDSIVYLQYIRLKAILALEKEYNPLYAKDLLFSSLKEDNMIEMNDTQLIILHNYIIAMIQNKEFDESKQLLEKLLVHLKSRTMSANKTLIPKLYYALGHIMRIKEQPKLLLKYSQKGIDHCRGHNDYTTLGYLYYHKAIALEKLEDESEAQHFFDHAFDMFRVLGIPQHFYSKDDKLVRNIYLY